VVTSWQSGRQLGQSVYPVAHLSQNVPAYPGKQLHWQFGGLPVTVDARSLQLDTTVRQSRNTQFGHPP